MAAGIAHEGANTWAPAFAGETLTNPSRFWTPSPRRRPGSKLTFDAYRLRLSRDPA